MENFVMGSKTKQICDIPVRRFGVELECFYPYASENSTSDISRLGWTVGEDCSIRPQRNHSAVELRSPPLFGNDGVKNLLAVCEITKAKKYKVNKTCGFHCHIDCSGLEWYNIKNIVTTWLNIQDYIFRLVPSSRHTCGFCKKTSPDILTRGLTKAKSEVEFARVYHNSPYWNERNIAALKEDKNHGDRYQALNVQSYWYRNTIEFRLHSGTTQFTKIVNWAALCSVIVHYSAERVLTLNEFKTMVPKNVALFYEKREEAFCKKA
jgi:hypothetical protein